MALLTSFSCKKRKTFNGNLESVVFLLFISHTSLIICQSKFSRLLTTSIKYVFIGVTDYVYIHLQICLTSDHWENLNIACIGLALSCSTSIVICQRYRVYLDLEMSLCCPTFNNSTTAVYTDISRRKISSVNNTF